MKSSSTDSRQNLPGSGLPDLETAGIHHVTAIASDPVRNLGFWAEDLGLRLVKKTVNFDDPSVYHLYFGDHAGTPGTILTFFPWPGARRGRPGPGQVTSVGLAIPAGSLETWQARLSERGVPVEERGTRLGERTLGLLDPDGLPVDLIETDRISGSAGPERAGVPGAAAIQGFHGVTIEVRDQGPTTEVLERLGWVRGSREGARTRFGAPGTGGPGTTLDVLERSGALGQGAAGTVHHLAFRAKDDDEQARWISRLASNGLRVTPVQDRQYFRSIYFREPGGVLFEIATDPPGFTVDEPIESLGESLRLPSWLEEARTEIERVLPNLDGPRAS